jgi:MFS family permease
MLYYPVISLTPVFFDRHRGFAMGIAMSGSGAGGLVFAPVTQSLLQRFGAPVTLRILGVWNFVICVAISFVIRPHPAYKPIRPSLALAKRGTFIVQVRTSRAYIQFPPANSRSAAICVVLSSRWKHNTLVLSDHILDLCARLLTYYGQHALGC